MGLYNLQELHYYMYSTKIRYTTVVHLLVTDLGEEFIFTVRAQHDQGL